MFTMGNSIHFVGVSGSLRKESFNTAMLNEAMGMLPAEVTMEVALIADIPLYNADHDLPALTERPEPVARLRRQLEKADAIVIVSPEYNYSIPGTIKNAIDWASRGEDSPLLGKPVAVMGATPGMWGTVRMQLAFQAVFTFLNMHPVQKPEVLIAQAGSKFRDGKLIDAKARELIVRKLEALKELTLKLRVSQG